MFAEQLEQMFEKEIAERTDGLKSELVKTRMMLDETKDILAISKKENNELKSQITQQKEFSLFKSMVDKHNFESLISYLGLKSSDISLHGMGSDDIPLWFKVLVTYYEDRERVFNLMDLFEIEYPQWAKTFKLPFEYNEDELDLIFDNLHKMYVANGCNFKNNMGFFYKEIRLYQGSLTRLFKNTSYVEIPWNLLLQNKLLITDKYFNKIIEAIEKKASHSEYFFAIQDYQEITKNQALRMFELLPKDNLREEHKLFIENNKTAFKVKPELAKEYEEKMNDNQYSTFYYLNYPLGMQINYVKNCKGYGHNAKFDLVKRMDISKEDKLKLLREIAEELL